MRSLLRHSLSLAAALATAALFPALAAAVGPALLTRPAAAGRAFTGEQATAVPARWRTPAEAVERRWIRCVLVPVTGGCRPADIAGATALTYVIAAADVGATVYVAERARDASGWSDWETSDAVGADGLPQGVNPYVVAGPAPPQLVPRWTALPSISGTWRVGATLAAAPGDWTPPADRHEYRWDRCQGGEDGEECELSEIAGATSRTYELTARDEGAWPQVRVRAHNANGWSPWASSLLEHWDPVGARVAGGPPAGGNDGATTQDAPAIRRLTIRPARFRAAARGAAFGPGAGGARVTVVLGAAPASLRFRVERRSGGRWRARGGTLTAPAPTPAASTIRLRFSGRVSGRRLPAGAYRLRATAVGRTGGLSPARTVRFTIAR